jgi:lactoylglutathione lyase
MKNIKSIILLVTDQQAALDFYTQKLGFEVHTDFSFGEDKRWLSVNLPQQKDLEIVLQRAETTASKARVGKQSDGENALLGFITEDIAADVTRFKKEGVTLVGELIDDLSYGKFIFFTDLYGNKMYLHQENNA